MRRSSVARPPVRIKVAEEKSQPLRSHSTSPRMEIGPRFGVGPSPGTAARGNVVAVNAGVAWPSEMAEPVVPRREQVQADPWRERRVRCS